jgi:hypothetical protein
MSKRSIAEYTRAEFDALRSRLENGRDTLRRGGALLQSVARGYYVVFALASFVAGKYTVRATHLRGGKLVTDQNFSHAEFPPLVYALYSGNKKETIQDVGSSPGIGSGAYGDREAYRHADTLMEIRVKADYGPTTFPEPYDSAQADAWLNIAKHLVQDLETLL